MMNSTVHPDNVLEALLSKGNRRDKQEKLQKLHEICSLEYSRHSQGARDLSVANISRIAESQGLFKARTIYNIQSSDYVKLINSWDAYNGPKKSIPTKKTIGTPDKYAFLQRIEDPSIRSLCHMALIERDKLKAEFNLLKSQTQVIVDMRPLGAEIVTGALDVASSEPKVILTESERIALAESIDSKLLEQRKWRIGQTGEIVDEKNRFVFKPGYATAILKIIELHGR